MAEIFGRSKHIGFWWSLVLMLFGGIPGWVAIIVSPSAKKNPTQSSTLRKYFGLIIIILIGLPGIIATIFQGFDTTFLRFRAGFSIGIFVFGIYLYKLGLGKIQNNRPKIYFNHNPIGLNLNNFRLPKVLDERMYHVAIEIQEQKSKVFNYEELRKSNILKQDTLVWYHGLSDWVRAVEVSELRGLINYDPPPIPHSGENLKVKDSEFNVFTSKIINSLKIIWAYDGVQAYVFFILLMILFGFAYWVQNEVS
jgi:hypothetical protein